MADVKESENEAERKLREAKDFAELIVDAVREGMLVLSNDFYVKSANEPFYQTFCVKPDETVGRLVFDLGNGQWNIPKLRELLEEMLPHNKAFNDFEVEHDFESIGYRIMRLNARRLDEHRMILLAIEDVTERERTARELKESAATLEDRVKERTRQVKALASALTKAEEEERRRIAQVLHDDLQQQLYGIRMRMSLIRKAAEAGNKDQLLKELEGEDEWLDTALKITRNLTVELSPIAKESHNLVDAVNALVRQMKSLHGLKVELNAKEKIPVGDESVRGLLYQIVRELLFNVVKHANVDQAAVELGHENGNRVISVADEGRGFNPKEGAGGLARETGFGLASIRERMDLFGGRAEIDSAPGKGTRVTLHVPRSFG